MSTNSVLMRKVNSQLECVYVHWDGYPDYMMSQLIHYSNDESVEELFSLGSISILNETVKESVFYCRDHNENWDDVSPKLFYNKRRADKWYKTAEYMYLYKNGEWKSV